MQYAVADAGRQVADGAGAVAYDANSATLTPHACPVQASVLGDLFVQFGGHELRRKHTATHGA